MMKQDQIRVVYGDGLIPRETDFYDVVGIGFWNNKLGMRQQVTIDQIREKCEVPVMREYPARDALQMTIEVMAKYMGDQKKIIDGLALSVKSHKAYSANLESGIRKILSKEEADRLIRSAHEN